MPIPHKDGFCGIKYSKIVAAEERLDEWFKQLQDNQPSEDAAEDANIIRSQLMLRLFYAQVQMVLYLPFLHYALRHTSNGSRTSLKAYACGSACVKAAMQAELCVIHEVRITALDNRESPGELNIQ
ncbi:Gypsy retrotransposon integrase-like protein 1 [Friedmanniomyces endolithicus]|nr:Gypsy retrotransposon integrase-like protein 1 [Friedmanniomyces endolithicus]KAK0774370.1 Gypsy retrotransposon integrase-like protein 1 [Friedmanniomyces endolithicus]